MKLQHKRVYNLQITGGKPFGIQPRGNPPLEHDGVKSLGQLLLTEDQFEEVVAQIEVHDAKWTEYNPLPLGEKKQIRKEQQRMANLSLSDLPTHQCPTCAMFEPTSDTFCVVEGWAPDAVREFVRVNANAKADLNDCPAGKEVPDGNSDGSRDS